MTETLTIRSRDDLVLEAELDEPAEAKAGLVLCHPHPRFGGTMSAPLLLALRDELVGRSWSVLRFNFRGVGASEGESSLGEAEVADALGAIDALSQRMDTPIAIAGWSFGGGVAVRTAAQDDRVRACAGIAPAVQRKEDISAGLPHPDELGLSIPLLVVVGSNDEQVAPAACRAFAEGVDGARFVEIPGANHFFWAKYSPLAQSVGDFFDEVV